MTIITEGLEISNKKKYIDDYTMQNVLHFPKNNKKVAELVTIIKGLHDKIKAEQLTSETDTFIDTIESGTIELLQSQFEKYKISNELFQYLDPIELYVAIQNAPNKNIDFFTRALGRRYNSTNIGDFLFEDFDTLSQLKDSLVNYMTQAEILQPRKFLLTQLINELEITLEKLLTTRTQR
jgi:hypothetical protein